MANQLLMPAYTYFGKNALECAENEIIKLGKKAFIVTGKSMIKQGHVKKVVDMLTKHNIETVVFSDIAGEPTDYMIEAGIAEYQRAGCDFMIGFGGGSPLDSAKAIGAMLTNEGEIADYNGKVITNPLPPLVAIPSTAGTGSEVTQFTIISDTRKNIKMLLKGPVLMPQIAIIDSQFTMQAPANVTAATGLDALTHAIEAYTSKKAFAETDMHAISAVKRIFQYLPQAYKDGTDRVAREQMGLAAFEAGVSFNNSSVTLVHGMSRPIGALFHVSHGISNAMLLGECLSFALDGTYERFGRLGKEIGVAKQEEDDSYAAEKFLEAVRSLCDVCNVPSLEEYGIERDKFFALIDKMAKDAYDSGSPSNTRKVTTQEDMKEIYKKLW